MKVQFDLHQAFYGLLSDGFGWLRSCELLASLQWSFVGWGPAGHYMLWFGVLASAGNHFFTASYYRTWRFADLIWLDRIESGNHGIGMYEGAWCSDVVVLFSKAMAEFQCRSFLCSWSVAGRCECIMIYDTNCLGKTCNVWLSLCFWLGKTLPPEVWDQRNWGYREGSQRL